jgi:hypothetical protein
MTYRKYSAGLVLAAVAALGIAGCAKDKPVGDGPPTTGAPSAAASGSASEPDAAGGSVVKGADLEYFTISMPPPKGAPADGTWRDVVPGKDGDVRVYYVDKKDKGYVGVEFLDCRLPEAQGVKDAKDKGSYELCFKKPAKTLKGYPLLLPDQDGAVAFRALVVNHVTIIASTFLGFEKQFTPADIEEYLGSLDLDTLAKM